jgi:hypothetical protein
MGKGFRDRRLEIGWDRQLEDDNGQRYPDCRSKNTEDRVYFGNMWWDRVYCANCGELDGLVTSDWTPHVFVLCNKCVGVNGEPEGMQKLTEDDMRAARYGVPNPARMRARQAWNPPLIT